MGLQLEHAHHVVHVAQHNFQIGLAKENGKDR